MSITKEKIIREAFNLFLQSTYNEVSLNDIVKQVGLTKGAFYHHFKSKEELFREIIDNIVIESHSKIYLGIPQDNLKLFMVEYIDRISQYIDKIKSEIDVVDSNKGVYFFSIMFDALRKLDNFKEKLEQMHKEENSTWIKVISNAKKSGEITTTLSSSHLARIFININDGVGMHLMLEGRFDDMPGEIFTTWNDFYNLIRTK